jgi:hypothetical protein
MTGNAVHILKGDMFLFLDITASEDAASNPGIFATLALAWQSDALTNRLDRSHLQYVILSVYSNLRRRSL